jgi:hypothetical protein
VELSSPATHILAPVTLPAAPQGVWARAGAQAHKRAAPITHAFQSHREKKFITGGNILPRQSGSFPSGIKIIFPRQNFGHLTWSGAKNEIGFRKISKKFSARNSGRKWSGKILRKKTGNRFLPIKTIRETIF